MRRRERMGGKGPEGREEKGEGREREGGQ